MTQVTVLSELWPIFGGAVLFLGIIYLISLKQVRDYKTYLDSHTAETARQTANQREMIEMQIAAIDRQTAVLDRIARRLEQDRPVA